MQYNVLALGLTETGGFGNTFPPNAGSPFDDIPGYEEVRKHYNDVDKKAHKNWSKTSPSLNWLNDKAAKYTSEAFTKCSDWKTVTDKILFNWKLNMDKLICEV